jgi:SMODS-associated and fused to various effectors sensor domain/TIR domain
MWLSTGRLVPPPRLSLSERDRLGTSVNPLGPVFISYRDRDGADVAGQLARQLRAIGLPVWLDVDDLPPGETRRRLTDALAAGLSGAVLVVTPDIRHSDIVKNVELPRLLALQTSADFSLAIANTISNPDEPSKPDFAAPNRILGVTSPPLEDVHQYPFFEEQHAARIAKAMALRRMEVVRRGGHGELLVDIATRAMARAFSHGTLPGLVIRSQPPEKGHRVAAGDAWQAFSRTVGMLPDLVSEAAVKSVRIRGNAHLSMGFALGSALPMAVPWAISVEPRFGEVWPDVSGGTAEVEVEVEERDPGGDVVVLVDCVEHELVSNAFDDLVDNLATPVAASIRLVMRRRLASDEGADAADAIAAAIRGTAARYGSPVVHIALRAPMPVALMLGRRLNTLEAHLYEWEDGVSPARYVHVATVSSGRGPVIAMSHEEI